MKLLFWASLINTIIFLTTGIVKKIKKDKDVPKSISLLFYVVSKLYFVWFLLSSTGAVSVFNQTLMPDEFSVTNMFAWMLCGVGFFSGIDNSTILKIHMVLAISGFVGVLVGLWIDYGAWQPLIISTLAVVLLYLSFRKKYWITLAVEIVLVFSMLYGYYTLIY